MNYSHSIVAGGLDVISYTIMVFRCVVLRLRYDGRLCPIRRKWDACPVSSHEVCLLLATAMPMCNPLEVTHNVLQYV